jgi:predicted DNA-binding transcriptional regulator YafY
MKVINTKSYQKLLLAQQIYDPEDTEEPLDLNQEETFKPEEGLGTTGVQTLTPEDFEGKSQDEIAEENIQEPVPTEEPPGYPKFLTPFQALRWAKHNNEVVRISYVTLSGKSIVRDVEPVGDFFAKTTGRRNLAVWDQNVGDIRTYIIAGIQNYQFKGEKFSPKFNFSQRRKNYKRRLRRRKNRML